MTKFNIEETINEWKNLLTEGLSISGLSTHQRDTIKNHLEAIRRLEAIYEESKLNPHSKKTQVKQEIDEVLRERGQEILNLIIEIKINDGEEIIDELSEKLKLLIGAVSLPDDFDEEGELRSHFEKKHLASHSIFEN